MCLLIFLQEINLLGSNWILKKKIKVNGTFYKYKARLFIKDFRQKKGLDVFDIYSPVTRITFIWMFIVLAVLYDLQIYQMDMKTTILNREFEEKFTWNNSSVLWFLVNKRRCANLLSDIIEWNKRPIMTQEIWPNHVGK